MTLLDRPHADRTDRLAASVDEPERARAGWGRAVTASLAVAAVVLGTWLAIPALGPVTSATPAVSRGDGLDVADYGRSGAVFLHYRHGEQASVRLSIPNRAPVPSTITGVTVREEPKPLLTPVGASPLPVQVPAGGSTSVELRLEFGNCRYWHERGAQTVSSLRVSGSTAGREWTRDVELTEPLVVHSQVIGNCPDRTLVRGDDTR